MSSIHKIIRSPFSSCTIYQLLKWLA